MLTITKGTPTEFQVFLFYGIVFVVFFAPILLISASLYGYLTRPKPTSDTNDTTPTATQALGTQSQLGEHNLFEGHVENGQFHYVLRGKLDESAQAVQTGAA
jgi:hypothetical protein